MQASKRFAFSSSMLGFLLLCTSLAASALPVHLRTEQLENPLGIDAARPAFSWQSDAGTPNWMQSAYQVLIATDAAQAQRGKANVWDSGKIASSESIDIRYAGPALRPSTRYFWAVRVWDNKGQSSVSSVAWFETGLLAPQDWRGKWIRYGDVAADREIASIHWLWLPGQDARDVKAGTTAEFRYRFHLDAAPLRATLHILARNNFVARVNGSETGDHHGWNSFDAEEIRSFLRYGAGAAGDNEILVQVIASAGKSTQSKNAAAFAASVRLTAEDGTEQRIGSDAKNWTVRIGDQTWAQPQELGPMSLPLLVASDHKTSVPGPDRVSTDVSLLRKTFSLDKPVRSARLYMTAVGAYRAYVNDKQMGPGSMLNPGFTDFDKRVLYQTYDVTSQLVKGTNAIATVLGGGWHGSPLTWAGTRSFSGPELLRGQLEIEFTDGSRQTIATDESWSTAPSAIQNSEIYGGESYDARAEIAGWKTADFDAKGWKPAMPGRVGDAVQLTAQPDLPIMNTLTVHPISLMPASQNHPAIFDMGQNIVGNIILHVQGRRGALVKIRYAERLTDDGGLDTKNLRNATVTDYITLAGGGDESFTPTFTFHGFRYLEVSGETSPLTTASVEGLVYNSLPASPSIRFTSSSEILNGMNQLGIWGERGNFVSVPTDCPQRDERLGWMGDAGVFWRTGSYNFDIASFTHKYMMDIDDAQDGDGAFTDVSPNVLGPEVGAPGWADAGVLVPYAAWQQYGDLSVVERSWPQMEHFMEFVLKSNPDYLRRNNLGHNYADWLAPDPNTPKDLIATAYWALIARDMKEMAQALHRPADAARYQMLYEHISDAYRKAFVEPDGSVHGDTQAGYVVTLYAGLAPEQMRVSMTERLVKNIEAHNNHLTTGFLGTPFLMFVLDENQRADVAYKLLLQETYPSWGYMVKKGATTWWERWNGDTGNSSMNSYNHYAFGSVMAWVFRRVAGIDSDASGPGFHHLSIHPHFDAALPQFHAEYDSMYGTVTTDWDQRSNRFTVTTPANTSGTIVLPNGKTEEISSGSHSFTVQ